MATKTKTEPKVETWNSGSWELYTHLVESGMDGKKVLTTVQKDCDKNDEYRAKLTS